MTPEQMVALGPAFATYLREFEDCFVLGHSRLRPRIGELAAVALQVVHHLVAVGRTE